MHTEAAVTMQASVEQLQTAEKLLLECVTFDIAPGIEPGGKPPVRIFLGSEEAQQLAERVFLYTVHKLRDPARVYQVYLMKNLPGFDRRVWRTGFTQYRFAIPELAGGCGRAIYNDVDQIYLTDPAKLFDLDLQGHGYLAVASNDTSVTLMDCSRMLSWWNLETARQRGKRELVQAPADEPGLWGPLDGGWNARDFEFRAGESGLLHYTTLHLQPWRPTPERYSYRPHLLGELWLRLQREADAEGYQPFTRDCPSQGYLRLMAERRSAACSAIAEMTSETRDFLSGLGIDDGVLLCTLDASSAAAAGCFNPALSEDWPSEPVPALAVGGVLERLSTDDLPWFLDALLALAQRALHLHVDLRQATAPDDRPLPARLRRPANWWRDRLAAAAERHPCTAWQLDLIEPDGAHRCFRYVPPAPPPRVWVLLGKHEGDNQQLLTLADALGWPYETRQLVFKGGPSVPAPLQGASLIRLDRQRSAPLSAPWPDLVLGAGSRSGPIARWIRRQTGGSTRLVQLGRPRASLDEFDLVVTTPQYRLPARDNVLHNMLPLNRPQTRQTGHALGLWRPQVEALPRPRIALLIGGDGSSSVLDEDTARRIREQAEALARSRGGSLLISTSPRTGSAAADALLGDSDIPGLRYRWRPDDADNPYPVFLELADELIVTGDSASMIADACADGRPVRYVALPHPKPDRLDVVALLEGLIELRHGKLGQRGTPRQQDVFGRWLDGLIASGLLWPQRDLTRLHEVLRHTGLSQPLDVPTPLTGSTASNDLQRTVSAVRHLFLRGTEIAR
ncbi:ELM1/GtrOC1 family putative glycosyltransferase [Methyloversatilis sp.]|uniref:ELM1/GtrOC1 family putative glycosyltransferase n=1 Tax=Methyloversatilis sp. TaxID=2569862 RepID=UPI0027BAA02E|nr:ELM1/GtrOC1 family putative glycosyltransferase [Methyloversatilis sp.]